MQSIRRCGASVALCLVVSVGPTARGQDASVDPNAMVAVTVAYADGRRSAIKVGPTSGGAWTPMFPRIASWTPPANEELVGAINYKCMRTPDGVRVAISVFRGKQVQRDEPVTTVQVTLARPVMVDAELRAIGIQPITLSLAPIAVPVLTAPSVTVVSPQIEVASVRVVSAPVPTYVITLRNGSTKAVRSIQVDDTRGGRPALSSRRAGREGDVLIAPGATYELGEQVPTGRPSPNGLVTLAPIDHVGITTVRWSDGSYDGDAATAAYDDVVDYGRRMQLSRILAEIERVRSMGALATPGALRAGLQELGVSPTDAMIDGTSSIARPMSRPQVSHAIEFALAQVKSAALDDLTDFESGRAAPGAFDGWLNTQHDRYQRWIARLGGV
jgi:hypothetical protein